MKEANGLLKTFVVIAFIFAFTDLDESLIGGALAVIAYAGLIGGIILHIIDNK